MSERNRKILATIHELIIERGYSPSYREIATKTSATLGQVARGVEALADAGLVTYVPREVRTVRVTGAGEDELW